MSDSAVSVIRWIIFGGAVMSLLQATILFEFYEKRLFAPLFAMGERAGGSFPAFMRSRTLRRAWAALGAVVFAALWWFLGTPGGTTFLRQG